MAGESNPLDGRDAARVLATLLVTPDDYIEDCRRHLLGEDAQVPAVRMQQARELSFEVVRALSSSSNQDWKRIEAGLLAIRKATAASSASGVAVASPSPLHDVAPAPPVVSEDNGSPWVPTRNPKPPVSAQPDTPPRPPRVAPPQEPVISREPRPTAQPTSTAVGDTSPLAGSELPFVAGQGVAPPPVAKEVAEEAESGGTVGIDQASPLAGRAPDGASPPATLVKPSPTRELEEVPESETRSDASAEAASLTLEQYASLLATLERRPEQRAATLRSYHLSDEAAYQALEARWRAQLSRDDELKKRFDELVAQYFDWLRHHPPS
jgi:hypothetical protein